MRKPFDDFFAKSVICFAVQNVQKKKNIKDLINLKGLACTRAHLFNKAVRMHMLLAPQHVRERERRRLQAY